MKRLDHSPVVVAHRDDINAGQGIQVAFAVDVPIMDSISSGHDEGVLAPFRHLIANKDVPEELLLGGLSLRDQVRKRGG